MTDADASPAVSAAVAEIRELVAADGGDVDLVAVTTGGIHLALVLPDEACRECVMPKVFLERVAAGIASKHGAPAPVTIDDPRDTAD
jgi:Fe-S cluster biogenesis protein NfuA